MKLSELVSTSESHGHLKYDYNLRSKWIFKTVLSIINGMNVL